MSERLHVQVDGYRQEVWLAPTGKLWVRYMDNVWGILMQDDQNSRGAWLDFERDESWEFLGDL